MKLAWRKTGDVRLRSDGVVQCLRGRSLELQPLLSTCPTKVLVLLLLLMVVMVVALVVGGGSAGGVDATAAGNTARSNKHTDSQRTFALMT